MKKVVTAAAICSVAAASTNLPSTAFCSKPPPLFLAAAAALTSSAALNARGGEATTANTTSVPDEADDTSHSTPAGPAAPKKKRKKKKPIVDDDDTPASEETSRKSKADEAAPQEEEDQSEPAAPPDPLLESLLLEDDYYAVLGLSDKAATESQITKAYRKRAVQTHPDKTGGDRRAFDKVSEAYEVLSDDTKRQVYNQYGKKGLEQGGAPAASAGSPEDLFRHFFGQQKQQTAPINRTVRYQLEVSLEDLYQGMERSILVEQVTGRKKVQVHIPKGTASGDSITLSGEMDGVPNATPGDLIFLLQQKPHDIYTRKGHDLVMEVHVSLEEAIGGVEREINHLDGRKLLLQSARRTETTHVWIQTGDVQVIKGEGMPKRDSTTEFGDLYVHFHVDLPNTTSAGRLTAEERELLRGLLRKMEGKKTLKSPAPKSDAEVKVLEKAKLADFGKASGTFRPKRAPPEDTRQRGPGSFYWSSNKGFGGSNPFFGGSPAGDDDGSNVQCQQM